MTTLTIKMSDDQSDYGPAMSFLNPRERAFVVAMTLAACDKQQVESAALAAGYSAANYGYELIRKKRVLEALREEADKKLLSGALLGAQALIEIVQDKSHPGRLKAADRLLAYNGWMPEQKIKVEHSAGPDTRRMIDEVKALAKQVGLDPARLLGQVGIVIDAEYAVVEDAA